MQNEERINCLETQVRTLKRIVCLVCCLALITQIFGCNAEVEYDTQSEEVPAKNNGSSYRVSFIPNNPKEEAIRALDDLEKVCTIAEANLVVDFNKISKNEGEKVIVENLSNMSISYNNAIESIQNLIDFADENWSLTERNRLNEIYEVRRPAEEWCPNGIYYSEGLTDKYCPKGCKLCNGVYLGLEKHYSSGRDGVNAHAEVWFYPPFHGWTNSPPSYFTYKNLDDFLSKMWRVSVFVEHAKSVISQSQQGGWNPKN